MTRIRPSVWFAFEWRKSARQLPGIEDQEIVALLFWIRAPATFIWAVLTLRSRPTAFQGIAKLVVGTFIVLLAMQEELSGADPVRLIAAGHASLAASSALLGLVDLIVIKLNAGA